MNERKYTDEEVIKALECCSKESMINCRNCPYEADCNMGGSKMQADALDFINRQKAEIEELEAEIDKQYEQARADILGNMADGGTSCHWCIEQHEAKAIKEFATEFKTRCIAKGIYPVVIKNILADLVEELTEGENG